MRIAQQVFDKLVHGNEQSWNSLITGYLKCGLSEHALNVYQRMQKNTCAYPGKHTFVMLLKACVNLNNFEACIEMHAEIARLDFSKRDVIVGNALVSTYIDCHFLARAQEVADSLLIRDATTWNVLMAAYANLGLYAEVLTCLEQMQFEGIPPDSITFACCLKACGILEDKEKGKELHLVAEQKGFLGADHVVGSALVDMYCKCGLLVKAWEVFDKLEVKDAVSWTILIRGYTDHGLGEEALRCFVRMQAEGVFPDAVTLTCSLKACVTLRAADKGQEIHLEIEKQGLLEGDRVMGNMLLDLYAKCDLLTDAHKFFERLPVRDSISYNALISGYADHGYDEEAFECFGRMQGEGVLPDAITYVCLLKAYGRTRALGKGREIHCEVERIGLMQKDIVIGNVVVDMYARCGYLAKANEVAENLPVRDIVTWTVLLAGYAEHGHCKEAMQCVEEMQLSGFRPDSVSLVCGLQACTKLSELEAGHELHIEIERKGSLEREIAVGNSLISMYSKWGLFAKARQVFDKLAVQDVVSWNALISGYANRGLAEEAFVCWKQMQREDVFMDTTTCVCLLKACLGAGALQKGRQLHAEVERKGLLASSHIMSNAVLNMYANCDSLDRVQQVFEELPVHDVISWTILIAKCAEHGYGEEALEYFDQMQCQGVSPDMVTFVCGLNACSMAGAAEKGGALHAEIERDASLEHNPFLANSLIHMYAKCGSIDKAQQVFQKLPVKDIVSWKALIVVYTRFGGVKCLAGVLDKMISDGMKPNFITCVIVLNACIHLGLFVKIQTYCTFIGAVSFLGRIGEANTAMLMSMEDTPTLHFVQRACRMRGNLENGHMNS